MKLPVYGGPGARAPRVSPLAVAADGENLGPLESRAHKASPVYKGGSDAAGLAARGIDSYSGTAGSDPGSSSASGSGTGTDAGVPPVPQYDLSADPVLQQVQAAVMLGDQQANASALNAREQALLNYGDPSLAAAVLGSTDPTVQAAGSNPESTLALLKRGYTQSLSNYDTTLDPSLLFSGARVKGEGLLGQTYQDDLAKAAAGIQSQLGGITDSLNAALATNQDKYLTALAQAYSTALSNALTNPPASTATAPAPSTSVRRSELARAAARGGSGRTARAV